MCTLRWWPLGITRGLAALSLAVACTTSSVDLRADVQAYWQRMSAWAPVEAETARTLERILATQFVDEAEVRHQIADSRPRLVAHLERAEGYVPRTPPLERLHRRYVGAWHALLAAYHAIEDGVTATDQLKLARARLAMLQWRATIRAVARELRSIAHASGVTLAPAAALRRPRTNTGA